jgi:hypothetical protein
LTFTRRRVYPETVQSTGQTIGRLDTRMTLVITFFTKGERIIIIPYLTVTLRVRNSKIGTFTRCTGIIIHTCITFVHTFSTNRNIFLKIAYTTFTRGGWISERVWNTCQASRRGIT